MDLSKEKAGLQDAGEYITRDGVALARIAWSTRRPVSRFAAGALLVACGWAVAPALGLLAAAGATALYGFEVIR